MGAILAGDAAAAARLTEAMDPELAAAHLDSAEVVRLQTAILKHAPSSVKRELLEAFAGSWRPVPQELGPTIVALLTSREGRATVESAARAAARITDRSLASLLETVIAKFSGEERACVVRALAAMRSDRAKDEATGGLASRVNAVRAHSLHALVELGELDAAATAAAEAVLEPDFVVRHAAARALTELGDTRGVEALTTDLASPLDLVRRSALVVVALLGERRQGTTVKELVGTKTVPTAAKLALIRILASSPSPAATPTIQSLLGHKKESIRLLVYESLGPEQVKLLKPVLLDRLQKEASAAARMALASTLEPVAPEARPVLGQLFASSPALRPVLWRILARVDRDKLCAAVGALGPPDSALDYALAARLVCAAGQR
ncbi:MAG: hypothetical protein HY815_02605 [Candidatus Riflebacteria bacterium]|nr:hypothetical protein [Candidatus Riflebacteria bacterium]